MAVAVLDHYADLAHAMYSDALTGAQALQQQVDAFLARPTEQNLAAAGTAWSGRASSLSADRGLPRQPDRGRLGRQGERLAARRGLIDYTAASYGGRSTNPLYTANVIANRTLTVGGRTVDASRMDKALLSETLQIDGCGTNVATGYHAIGSCSGPQRHPDPEPVRPR